MLSTGSAPTVTADSSTRFRASQTNKAQQKPGRTSVFAGKVALVTGSESGIGRETARELARQGAFVMLNGLNPERLNQTLNLFLEEGLLASAFVADITDLEDCKQLIKQTLCDFGQLDILITNASISMRAYFVDTSAETFARVLNSNVYGAVYPLKAALPYLLKSKGCVTFISSISALNGMPSGSAYCAGKAAITNLAHTLQLELGHTGLHVGVVHIGFTRNDPDKWMLNGEGEPVPLAPRPERFKMTQTAVARAIIRHIQLRRNTSLLSPFGKFMGFMTRYFPTLTDHIIRWTMRRWRHMYE